MNKQEKNKAIKEIKRLWNKAEYILNNCGWNMYGKELLRVTREESKGHDNFRGDSIKRGITITEESKFFAIQRLLSSLYCLDDVPSLDGYHHTQKSVYFAYSLSNEFQKDLKKEITKEESIFIHNMDYCKLIEEVV